LEQKAHSLEIDIATAKTNGPTDEVVKVMVQEEMNKKTETEHATGNGRKTS